MSQNLRNFSAAVYGFDAVVQRMPAEAWDQPSGCGGWSGREVLTHQCAVLNGVAEIARTRQMAAPAPPDDVSNPVATWNQCRDALFEALDQEGAITAAGPFWFDAPTVDDLIGVVQWDPLGHSWDLAQTCGMDAAINETVAQSSLDWITERQDMLIESGRIGQPVDVGADASVVDRFLGACGRDPR